VGNLGHYVNGNFLFMNSLSLITARRVKYARLRCIVNGGANNCNCDGEIICKAATSISEKERKLHDW
jgi:hypothetical protein